MLASFPTCGGLLDRQFKGAQKLGISELPVGGCHLLLPSWPLASLMLLSVTALGVDSLAVIMGVMFLRSHLSHEDVGEDALLV